MTRHNQILGNWPDPTEELLLTAAVSSAAPIAVDAWERWNRLTNLDAADGFSFRMMPLVYHNLNALGWNGPDLELLKGIFRRAWYKNQILYHRLADILLELSRNGIEVMVLKGVALSIDYYASPGCRTMNDMDILVRPEDALATIRMAREAGWTPLHPRFDRSPGRFLASEYSLALSDGNHLEIDVHWFALSQGCYDRADESFWKHRVNIQIGGIDTFALDATDLLIHVCAHGVATHSCSPMQWIADMLTILRSDRQIDWQRFVNEVEQRGLVRPVRDALAYLCDQFEQEMPEEFRRRLDDLRTRPREILEYWTHTKAAGTYSGALALHGTRYLRKAENGASGASLRGFLRYLQDAWVVADARHLPAAICSRLFRAGIRKAARGA